MSHHARNRAVAQVTLLSQSQKERLCIDSGVYGLSIPLQQPVGMDSGCLPLLVGSCFESFQQSHLLALYKRLVRQQGCIKAPLLIVTPDMDTDRLCPGNSTESSQRPKRLINAALPSIRTRTWRVPLLLRREGGFLMMSLRCCQ